MRPLPAALLVWFALVASGCSSPNAAISAPSYDPDAMTHAALQQLDKNGNGTIEGAELDSAPGLKSALAAIDTNNDKKLSGEELQARFQRYAASGAGAVGYGVRVTLDGQPLADATITFTPESFMGGAIGEATVRTGADGTAGTFQVKGESLPGLPPGIYRVSVTKDGATIPARFNTQTTLGCEVFAGGRGGSTTLDLKLSSR